MTCFEKPAVYDSILSESCFEELAQFFQDASWKFGWRSNTIGESLLHWNLHLAGGGKSSMHPCDDEIFSNDKLKPVAELWREIKNTLLPDHLLVRCYGNAHTFGLDGTIHRDNKKSVPLVTTLIYCHRLWPLAWGGEIIFYNDACDSIDKVVHPKPGRLVLFDGATPHVAKSPTRICRDLRISLVFKSINKHDLLQMDSQP